MNASERPFGFNVIGHVTANAGLGVAARNWIDLVDAHGHPVAAFDLPDGQGRGRQELAHEACLVDSLAKLPYAINVFVFPLHGLHLPLGHLKKDFDYASYFNASLCYWELPTVPPRWIDSLESLDALVASSDYMAHVYRCSISNTAVVEGSLPVNLPTQRHETRFRNGLGIPSDAVVFVTTFEPASDPVRKNPLATVDAFLRAVGDDEHAYLIVRVNNARSNGIEHEFVATLRQSTGGHPRILIVGDPLSYVEIIGLYSECDVFVSLHRAEGFGLAMAEAMLLGKPVIATGWSGNLTFMDRLSACLVGYRLVPVEGVTAYDANELEDNTVWAEADTNEAATWIRLLASDPALRTRIGEAGRERMLAYNRDANEGRILGELRALWEQRATMPRSRSRVTAGDDGPLRASRLARYQAMEREMRWIKSRMSYRVATEVKRLVKENALTRLLRAPRR